MYEKMKRTLALVLVLSILISLVSMTASAQTATGALVLDTPQSVTVTGWEESVSLTFVPEADGYYLFSSVGDLNTFARLHDADMNLMYDDEDSGAGDNFAVGGYLTAGATYYLLVGAWSAGNFSVVATRSPVASIAAEPVTIIENTNCSQMEDGYTHYWWTNNLNFTITFTDGSSTFVSGSGFHYNGEYISIRQFDDQSAQNSWQVGDNHLVTISVLGYECQIPVSVVASPVESISVEPMTLVENAAGNMVNTWNPDTGNNDLYYFDYDWYNRLHTTITFTDGSTQSFYGSGFNYNGTWTSVFWYAEQSYYNQWTAGNTYTGEVSFMGKSAQVDITIVESPVSGVIVDPITIASGTKGYYTSDRPGGEQYYRYNWQNALNYTLVYKDGSTQYVTGNSEISYGGQSYRAICTDTQSLQTPWEADKTYAPTVSVLGCTTQVSVRITGSPITSIAVQPISIMENDGGELYRDWDSAIGDYGPEYYRYSWWNKLRFTITFTDGSTQSVYGGGFVYDGEYQSVSYDAGQSYSDPWTAGNTYTPTISVMGHTAEVPVTITASPVAGVTVQPISMMEGTEGGIATGYDPDTGNYDAQYYRYSWWNKLVTTITYTDGTTQEFTGTGFYYNGEWTSVSHADTQDYTNQWKANNTYTPTITVMGYTAEVSVTINPTPVQSISVEPILMAQNKGGYWSSHWENGISHDYYRYYWWENMTTTITFTDGSTRTVSGTSFEYDGQWFGISYVDWQSYEDQLLVDNTYTFDVSCMGAQAQASVTIKAATQTDGFEYIQQNGSAIITDCTKTDKVLQIPETLDGYTVVGIISLGEASQYTEQIVIPDTVTMLGTGELLQWNTPLKKITLGAGITAFNMNIVWAAAELQEIAVSANNPNYCSVDGVLYDKAVTTMVAYPQGKTTTHVIPDSVTDIDYLFGGDLISAVHVQTGAGTPQYKTVDGVVYSADMSKIYSCAAEKTGSYVMPETVTEIARFALSDTNLQEVTVAPGVTEITYGSFYRSGALEKIVIPESVKSIGLMAFEECNNLEQVHIENLVVWCQIDFVDNPLIYGENLYLDGQLVQDLVIPDVVSTVYYSAFYNANLNSVTIPSTVVSIGDSAFRESSVKTLNLTEGLERIGYSAFREADVQAVHLPDSLTYLAESAFRDCESLQELTIGTGLVEIMWNAFTNTAITSLVIPENVEVIFENAFTGASLKEVVFENDAIYIGYAAFKDCPLEAINLGENVSYIEDKAFMGNKAVTLKIPDSVTHVSYRCFDSSDNLISVTVPETVQSIDTYAFDNSYHISHVYYGGTEDQWEAMEENSPELQAAKVHYEAQGDEFSVTYTCTEIKHYCEICAQWDIITRDVASHNMVNGVCTVCGHTDGPAKSGWTQEGGKWCYYENGAKVTNCWKEDSVGWCYLGSDGYMVTNSWMKDSVGWCYLGSNGYIVTGQWIEEADDKYYVGSNGYMVTGTQTIGGKEYKFGSDGKLHKHTVTFCDADGGKLSETVYFYGDTVTAPAAPAKAEDQVGSYTFAGWDKTVTAVTGDVTYTATYNITYKEYTITFMGMYGLIEKQTLHWNDEINPPIVLTEEDEDYYYYFASWDKELVAVAGDATYTAVYDKESKPEILLNGWIQESGQWYYYENSVKLTNAWAKDSGGWCYLGSDGTMVVDDFIIDNGGLYCLDHSGHMVTNKWMANGSLWSYLGSDGRAITNSWIKDSAGWCYLGGDGYMVTGQWIEDNGDKYYINDSGYMVTGTYVVNGSQYKFAANGTLMKHTVTFCDADGEKLSEAVYFYGDTVTEPAAPAKAEDQVGSYTFAGWDKAVTAVTGDTTYTATYDIAYKEYTITFLNSSGGIVEIQTLHWNDTVTAPTARNYEDETTVYTFAGWDKTVVAVAGDATYTAVYTPKLKDGWIQDGAKWTYYDQGRKVVDDWVQDGAWYFIGDDGYMVTNTWASDGNGFCYLGADGKMQVNKWIQESQAWLYVDNTGHMVTNTWVKDSGGWCYLGESGYMVRDCWVKDSVGFCYLNKDGRMVYNKWIQDENGWRYVDKTGYVVTNKWVKDSIGWCFVGVDGYTLTNTWVKDATGWCYLGENGYQVFNKWFEDEEGARYVDNAGYLVTNRWVKDSTGWRFAGEDGYVHTDRWIKDSVGWCFVGDDGYMLFEQWVEDSTGMCYVDASGYQVIDRWVKDSIGWSYVDKNGYQVTNRWIKDSVGWCYIGEDGYMIASNWVKDSAGWCYLDEEGRMVYNKWVDDDKSYVNNAGYKVVNGWVKHQGKWYYMDAQGNKLTNTSQKIGNKTYHFDASGVCTNP